MTHLFSINKLFLSLPLSSSLSCLPTIYYAYDVLLPLTCDILRPLPHTIDNVINNNHSGQRDKNNILVII